ncbi:hypothetical protein EDC01DRAFT_25404 [Geopyxis carbonaria]|nr:hypothetical protein EDC01DRAFT_25404 [Geopyxis carbonaria]
MLSQVAVDSVPRRLLPQQVASMQQSISLSPTDLGAGPRENQRNYVFVDEHNRHKRLKVMRACEGCRRRKIKCDAATTNTWPCSACTRLKLHCVPPMVQYDRDFGGNSNQVVLDHDNHVEFEGSSEEDLLHGPVRKQSRTSYSQRDPSNGYRTLSTHSTHSHHQPQPYSAPHPYQSMSAGEAIEPPLSGVHFQTPVYHNSPPVMRPHEQWGSDNEYAAALVGQLRIDDTGVASYISAQSRRLAQTPAYEPLDEGEPNNPSFMPRHSEFAVKISDEDLPSPDDTAEMFSIFFNHIHPYLPIVDKATFLHKWNTAREQLSPLLIESIFACAGRLTTDPSKGLKWIGLASRHLDCFLDVPRLSTVQAMLLLLKARESAPQRGYFFRSWMSVVQIIAMARDLGLESHHDLHMKGTGCGEGSLDCMVKSRVWQACFSYELMISAPQGRHQMQCNPDSVDLSPPPRDTDLDEQEIDIHRNFLHLICLVKNIRRMTDVHTRLKSTTPGWRNDPQLLASGPSLEQWLFDLPPHLHIQVSTDLSQPPPHVDSHFAGNLQVYYHLARMMLHRPALAYGKTFALGGEWRQHMSICTNAAKSICRLEEVIFEHYGMLGFQCMSRGVNFSIYSLLSGAMIHLIAATCPDPEFNADAKDYFSRTMRLLENCIDNSASQEVKGQIETLREAFSVDVNQPFVLNPSFPFYPGNVQPPVDLAARAYTQAESVQATMTAAPYTGHPLSPPHSTGDVESKGESPAAVQSLVMLAAGQGAQPAPNHMVEQVHWNPSRLFDNWNTAFGVNGSTGGMPNSAMNRQHDSGLVDSLGGGHSPSSNSYIPTSVGLSNSFVSPGMWQDSVAAATVFSDSQKRPFPFNGETSWSTPTPTQGGTGMRTPTSTTVGGVGVAATSLPLDGGPNSSGARGH